MYAIDLFENTNPVDQSAQIPVAPHVPGEKNRQIGNANLAALISALNNPENPSVSIQFLDGSRTVLSSAQLDLIIYYYNKILTNKTQKANFLYRTFVSRNKLFTLLNQLEEKKTLAQAGQKSFSFAPAPVEPDEVKQQQLELFKEEEKKSSKYKDVAVQRAMRQAIADFPSADSDTEAFAKSIMVQQDQDQKNINRLKSATDRAQELIAKNNELDRTQERSIDAIQGEIDKVEKDNNSLSQMVQQMTKANAELQQKLARMRSKAPAQPTTTVAEPKPQVGVSVATDKQAPTEPETQASTKRSNIDPNIIPPELEKRQVAQGAQNDPNYQRAAEDLTHGLEEAEVIPTKQVLQGYVVEFNPRTNVITISQRGQALKQIKLKLATRRGYEQLVNKFIHSQEDEKYPDDIEDRDVRLPMRKVAEGSVFGQQDFDTQMDLAKLKSQLTQPKAAQSAPASTTQPVSYQPPARLSDLQARHQRVEALTKIKGEIEDMQQKATKGGRMLPRGLAADLEDYFTTADIDTAYDDMMAKYQKQLAALQQYLGMRKALWSPKKDVHEMKAREIEESKSEVWTIHFTDGTAVRYRASDETDPAAVRKHYANKGKTVAKFDYGFGVDQPAGPGPEAHEPGSGRAVSARTGETLPEDTMSEFKAAALAKIKKALANPKLDPATRKDYETRLYKLQALEEGNVIPVDFRQGAGSEDFVAFKNTRGDYFDKIARASQAGDVESVKRLRVELKDLEDAARRRGLIK